jgi:hypothetical protein
LLLGPACLLVALVVWSLLAAGGQSPAEAQSIFLTPSFGVTEAYDSNVTLTSNATSDFVTSLIPGLAIEFKDFPFTLALSASLTMQVYAKNPSLDTYTDNITAAGSLSYSPTSRLTLSLGDTYSRNVNPSLVTPDVAVTTGRFASTSNTLSPTASYKLDQVTTANLAYSWNVITTESPVGTDSNTHTITAGVSREWTPVLTGGLQFVYNLFTASGQPNTDTYSPQITLAVRWTPTITVSSSAGPIWIQQLDGSYKLDYTTVSQYAQAFDQGRGIFTLGYSQVAGTGGITGIISTTQSATASISYQMTQALKLTAGGGWSKTESVGSGSTGSTLDVQNYTAGASLSYQLLRWLTFDASYRFFQQSGVGNSANVGISNLTDHIVTIGVTAKDKFRVY